jgi:hypothetical protein
MKTLNVPCYGIQVTLDDTGDVTGISSGLREYLEIRHSRESVFETVVNNIEAIIISHAYCGVDVESPAYAKGIEMWVETMVNKCFPLQHPLNNTCR